MPDIDGDRIAEFLRRGDEADSASEKGRALEDLIEYLFELVPGVSLAARDRINATGSEEIDLAFWNEGEADGLRLFDFIVLVECKNWSSPAGHPELVAFEHKLETRGRRLGIFVAAEGITGNPKDRDAAHRLLETALAAGREVLVLTRSEIESLQTTDQLVTLLKRKRVQLAVSGTIFEGA